MDDEIFKLNRFHKITYLRKERVHSARGTNGKQLGCSLGDGERRIMRVKMKQGTICWIGTGCLVLYLCYKRR
jgi:hypothetical protein